MAGFKKSALLILCALYLPIIAVGVFNYTVDPFQIYRQQTLVKPSFCKEQRPQNAGLIRSYLAQSGYDSLILGSSVADNYIPSHVAQWFGWQKAMRLTINGCYIDQQIYLLEQALRTGAIKNVFWSVRPEEILTEEKDQIPVRRELPYHLYTASWWDDGPYLFSLDNAAFSWQTLRGTLPWEPDLNRLYDFMDRIRTARLAAMQFSLYYQQVSARLRYFFPPILPKQAPQPSDFPPGFSRLVATIANHSHTNFVILFPPVSRWALKAKTIWPGALRRYFTVQWALVEALAPLPNVRVYGFDDVEEVVGNLANYMDAAHFHWGVNDWILLQIACRKHLLTKNNISDYLTRTHQSLSDYRPYFDYQRMIPVQGPGLRAYFQEELNCYLYRDWP
ncbi:MAG: hypothetical protein KQJ78_09540 [Deltaproteobacteria bacterium]|nr:hypothetical protein [Deltaproteobacteria bacterium]